MFEPRLSRLLSKIQGSFQWNLNWKMVVYYNSKDRQDRYSSIVSGAEALLILRLEICQTLMLRAKINWIWFFLRSWDSFNSWVGTGINSHLETENKNIKLYLAVPGLIVPVCCLADYNGYFGSQNQTDHLEVPDVCLTSLPDGRVFIFNSVCRHLTKIKPRYF